MNALLHKWIIWIFKVALLCFTLLGVLLSGTNAIAGESDWQIDVVDGGNGKNVGKYTALVIDKGDNLHIGYFDETRGALRYGFRAAASSSWYTMEVDASGGFESLAVDPDGHPHFAYDGPDESGLRYAWWDGKKWTKQTLDNERVNYFNSIRIASDGLPRISYYHRLNRGQEGDAIYANHLKYASFDGRTWYTETVDSRSGTGKFNSLALDAQGRPHISYSEVVAGDLRYARWDGSEWHFSMPDSAQSSGGWVGTGSSIEVDATGNPHIAYVDVAHRAIKYASWTPKEGWKTEKADQLIGRSDNIDRVSLKLDSKQQPHIAYWDSGLNVLKYSVKIQGRWQSQIVDNNPNVGQYPSLALDSHGKIYIAYYDAANGALRVAHTRNVSEPSPVRSAEQKADKESPKGLDR